jgi:hypothetical protein
MKKGILILVCGLILAACNEKVALTEENISGVWKASNFESTVPNIPAEYQEAGKQEFMSSVYTLNSDNSFELRSDFFSSGALGRWEFNPETKELSMFYEMDTTHGVEKFNVTELSGTSMTLRQDIPSMNAFVQLELKKSK